MRRFQGRTRLVRLHYDAAALMALLLFAALCVSPVHAGSRYFFFCEISEFSVVTLQYNQETMQYEETDDPNRRLEDEAEAAENVAAVTAFRTEAISSSSLRRTTTPTDGYMYDESDFDLSTGSFQDAMRIDRDRFANINRRAQGDEPQDTIEMRPCACAGKISYPESRYYCPVSKTHCGLPGSFDTDTIEPGCLNLHDQDVFAQSMWPILLIWYGIAVIFCFCTVPGRNALGCCINKMSPTWNTRVVDRMVVNNPSRANAMIRNQWSLMSDLPADAAAEHRGVMHTARSTFVQVELPVIRREPTEFSLKTRIYKSRSEEALENEGTEEEEKKDCTICFAPLEEGDRVGALECQHVFHVACLKGWIKRRNVCPLCMTPDIAQRRSNEPQTAEQQEEHLQPAEQSEEASAASNMGNAVDPNGTMDVQQHDAVAYPGLT